MLDQVGAKRPRHEELPPGGSRDTLCIRSIPRGAQPEAVEALLHPLPGFVSVNLQQSGSGVPVAFALFAGAAQAAGAIAQLRGASLPDMQGARQPLSVEYARRSTNQAR